MKEIQKYEKKIKEWEDEKNKLEEERKNINIEKRKYWIAIAILSRKIWEYKKRIKKVAK